MRLSRAIGVDADASRVKSRRAFRRARATAMSAPRARQLGRARVNSKALIADAPQVTVNYQLTRHARRGGQLRDSSCNTRKSTRRVDFSGRNSAQTPMNPVIA